MTARAYFFAFTLSAVAWSVIYFAVRIIGSV